MELNQHENDMDLIQFAEDINSFPWNCVDINYVGTKNISLEYEK